MSTPARHTGPSASAGGAGTGAGAGSASQVTGNERVAGAMLSTPDGMQSELSANAAAAVAGSDGVVTGVGGSGAPPEIGGLDSGAGLFWSTSNMAEEGGNSGADGSCSPEGSNDDNHEIGSGSNSSPRVSTRAQGSQQGNYESPPGSSSLSRSPARSRSAPGRSVLSPSASAAAAVGGGSGVGGSGSGRHARYRGHGASAPALSDSSTRGVGGRKNQAYKGSGGSSSRGRERGGGKGAYSGSRGRSTGLRRGRSRGSPAADGGGGGTEAGCDAGSSSRRGANRDGSARQSGQRGKSDVVAATSKVEAMEDDAPLLHARAVETLAPAMETRRGKALREGVEGHIETVSRVARLSIQSLEGAGSANASTRRNP